MVKVSVILPVYGVAEYIVKCTESLLAQTLNEMEFLFVDDHGPDNSIELLRQTIAGHPRENQFHVLRPEHNMGAGMARNFAIPEAKGEYIAFVDSDDSIDPQMFERLYNEAMRSDSDLCCCQMQKYYPDGSRGEILENPHVEPGMLDHDKRAYILTHYVSLFASILFRRSLVEQYQLRFPEDRSADDSYFVSCAWMTARSVSYVDQPFYHYLIRPGSVCTTKDSDKYKKRMRVFEKLMVFAREQGVYDEYADELDYMFFKKGYIISVVNYVTNALEPRRETIREIAHRSLEQIPHYRSNPYIQQKKSLRIMDWLIRHHPRLAVIMLRQYAKRKQVVC